MYFVITQSKITPAYVFFVQRYSFGKQNTCKFFILFNLRVERMIMKRNHERESDNGVRIRRRVNACIFRNSQNQIPQITSDNQQGQSNKHNKNFDIDVNVFI